MRTTGNTKGQGAATRSACAASTAARQAAAAAVIGLVSACCHAQALQPPAAPASAASAASAATGQPAVPALPGYRPPDWKQREAEGPLERIRSATQALPPAPAPRKAPPARAPEAAARPAPPKAAPLPAAAAVASPSLSLPLVVRAEAGAGLSATPAEASTPSEWRSRDADSPVEGRKEPFALLLRYSPDTQSAVLSWTVNEPAPLGVRIERRQAEGDWSQIAYLRGAVRSFTDSTLTPGTRYEYRVLAFRAGGPSSGYPQFEPLRLETRPGALLEKKEPYAVSARFDTATRQALIRWEADPQPGSSYRVEMRGADASWKQIAFEREPVRALWLRELTPGSLYELRVVAFRAKGSSAGYAQQGSVLLPVPR